MMPPEDDLDFGELLRLYRRRANLTQEDVANKLVIKRQTYSDIENGGGPQLSESQVDVLVKDKNYDLTEEEATRLKKAWETDLVRRVRQQRGKQRRTVKVKVPTTGDQPIRETLPSEDSTRTPPVEAGDVIGHVAASINDNGTAVQEPTPAAPEEADQLPLPETAFETGLVLGATGVIEKGTETMARSGEAGHHDALLADQTLDVSSTKSERFEWGSWMDKISASEEQPTDETADSTHGEERAAVLEPSPDDAVVDELAPTLAEPTIDRVEAERLVRRRKRKESPVERTLRLRNAIKPSAEAQHFADTFLWSLRYLRLPVKRPEIRAARLLLAMWQELGSHHAQERSPVIPTTEQFQAMCTLAAASAQDSPPPNNTDPMEWLLEEGRLAWISLLAFAIEETSDDFLGMHRPLLFSFADHPDSDINVVPPVLVRMPLIEDRNDLNFYMRKEDFLEPGKRDVSLFMPAPGMNGLACLTCPAEITRPDSDSALIRFQYARAPLGQDEDRPPSPSNPIATSDDATVVSTVVKPDADVTTRQASEAKSEAQGKQPVWSSSKPRDDRFLQEVLGLALMEARRTRKDYVGTPHLFIALTELDGGCTQDALHTLGFAPKPVRNVFRLALNFGNARSDAPTLPTRHLEEILQTAERNAANAGAAFIDERTLAQAVLSEKAGVTYELLSKMGINPGVLSELIRTSNAPVLTSFLGRYVYYEHWGSRTIRVERAPVVYGGWTNTYYAHRGTMTLREMKKLPSYRPLDLDAPARVVWWPQPEDQDKWTLWFFGEHLQPGVPVTLDNRGYTSTVSSSSRGWLLDVEAADTLGEWGPWGVPQSGYGTYHFVISDDAREIAEVIISYGKDGLPGLHYASHPMSTEHPANRRGTAVVRPFPEYL